MGSGIDAYLDAVKQAPIRGQKNKFKNLKDQEMKKTNWSDDDVDNYSSLKKGKTLGKSKISKPKQI